ncbi:hypothetical protein HD806DRAFT_498644 [Xylariaceae sp. AK1471]|nr:hypothetical protein HD806DRAFT_498644 [Xylariaceae sp. AK1471]
MAAPEGMAPLVQSLVWIIAVISLLFLSMRLYIKWRYRGSFWYDDYALIASLVLVLVNAGVIQHIVMLGYGMHVKDIIATKPENIRLILIYLQIASGIIRLSVGLARVSFAITLLQLCNKWETRFVWVAIVSLLAVMIPAIIIPFVSCRPYERIFDKSVPGVCLSANVSLGYFYFHGAYTALVDFTLVFLPWRILMKLQIRRFEKIGAGLAMSLGILSGAITIVKVVHTAQINDSDWTYSSVDLAIWNMVEPSSIIIAASLPNLRVFIIKNKATLVAGFRLGSNTQLTTRKSQKSNDVHLDKMQSTMKAISAGTDHRRGEATAWITSRGDDGSEKSILREARAVPITGIVQTTTFAVEYPDEERSASSRDRR